MSLIIGIDGDLDKSGVAIWDKENAIIELKTLGFFQLLEYLTTEKEKIKIVKIEAGFLNQKSNFHFAKSKGISDRISKNVGENQAVGKLIIQMCQHLEIPYKLVKPFQKTWNTKSGKISDKELKLFLHRQKINLTNKTTNQETRDSALIALYG